MKTMVLLSGGVDSAIALCWALYNAHDEVFAITVDHGQHNRGEVSAAYAVFKYATEFHAAKEAMATLGSFNSPELVGRKAEFMHVKADELFIGWSSSREYDVHGNLRGALDSMTPDKLAVLTTIAAHRLLKVSPNGGMIITGMRDAPRTPLAGQPHYNEALSYALSLTVGQSITLFDPLGRSREGSSRSKALLNARPVYPSFMEMLMLTTSCLVSSERDRPCNNCSGCHRRSSGFAAAGMDDFQLRTS